MNTLSLWPALAAGALLILASGCSHKMDAAAAAASTSAASAASAKPATPAAKSAGGPHATTAVPATAPRTLRFGTGGGFTGGVTAYTLYPDGRLERRQGMPGDTTRAGVPLAAPPAVRVKAAFAAFDALPADSLTLNQPGNMYTFLEGRTAAGRPVRLTWGGSAQPAHAVRALYRDLTALVPQQ